MKRKQIVHKLKLPLHYIAQMDLVEVVLDLELVMLVLVERQPVE